MNKYLVIYDIRNERRLAKIAKIMERYGSRVQKSVFELQCSKGVLNSLRFQINTIRAEEDSIVYFELCPKCWQKKKKIGLISELVNEDKNYIVL